MFRTGDLKIDAILKEYQEQLTALSEGKALYAVRIAELDARIEELTAKRKRKPAASSAQPTPDAA